MSFAGIACVFRRFDHRDNERRARHGVAEIVEYIVPCARRFDPERRPDYAGNAQTKNETQGVFQMRSIGHVVLASAALAIVTGPALAQAPQTEKNVSMMMAMAIIQGTIEQCTKDGYKVSVTVVDKAGNVAASVRGDGTNPHTLEFSRLKAYTSRTRGQTSLEFMKLTMDPANAYLRQIPGTVAVGGAVPIKIGNEVIGAVGASGAPGGEKDEVCVLAGIAKVQTSLQ